MENIWRKVNKSHFKLSHNNLTHTHTNKWIIYIYIHIYTKIILNTKNVMYAHSLSHLTHTHTHTRQPNSININIVNVHGIIQFGKCSFPSAVRLKQCENYFFCFVDFIDWKFNWSKNLMEICVSFEDVHISQSIAKL